MGTKKERIWELDAFRGVFIVGMVVVHILYDIKYMFGQDIYLPPIYDFVKTYGSWLFILLSGICVTLGRHNVKRGATVLGLGLGITVVMEVLCLMAPDRFGHIYFGILHFLGFCMLVYPLFAKLPWWALCIMGAVIIGLTDTVTGVSLESNWLLPVGITNIGTEDYFPLFPHLGTFLIGIALGKTLYKDKKSRIPVPDGFVQSAPVRFFSWCGRQSLWIYIGHQPLVYLTLSLLL